MKEYYEYEYIDEYNTPTGLSVLSGEIEFIKGHIIATRDNYYYHSLTEKLISIIPITTGISTVEYDFARHINEDVFIVFKSWHCRSFFKESYNEFSDDCFGIISSNGTVLCPLEYSMLTIPVDGYLFAVKYNEKTGLEDLFFVDIKGRITSPLFISSKDSFLYEFEQGLYKIVIQLSDIGLKSISVPDPHILGNVFAQLINEKSAVVPVDENTQPYYIWRGNMFDDGKRNTEYDSRYCWDENDEWYYENMKDSWDSITGGAYGDMPEGWDGDMEFMGH